MKHGLVTLILSVVFISGCGSGGDEDALPANIQFVTNKTLEGLYNQVSACYTTNSNTAIPKVDARNAEYNLATILSPLPTICDTDSPLDLVMKSYNFPSGNVGLGALDIVRSSDQSKIITSVDYLTDHLGGLAVFSVPAPTVTTPVLGIQLKGVPSGSGSFKLSDFDGSWAFLSLQVNGRSVAAEIDLSNVGELNQARLQTGYQSNDSVSPLVLKTGGSGLVIGRTSTSNEISLNSGLDKLNFLGWEWFLNPAGTFGLTGGGASGPGFDRLAVMFRPRKLSAEFEGTYEIIQWTTFSSNISVPGSGVTTTDIPSSEIVRRGRIEFRGGTAVFDNLLGLTNQSISYDIQPGTDYMYRFSILDNRQEKDVFIRFFVSHDQKYLIGVDLADESPDDHRTALLVGIRHSFKAF